MTPIAALKTVRIDAIDPNPHRGLAVYPWIERKIERLVHSINDVGLWESVIVRPQGERFEQAFGHHRMEAARRAGLKEVPVIIRMLGDADMLQFMGRENGEDYGSEFLVMLNTWEAAVKFLLPRGSKNRPVDIARFLGWTLLRGPGERKGGDTISPVARACAGAYELIERGHIERANLEGVTIPMAREVLERAAAHAKALPSEGGGDAEFSAGVKKTIDQVKAGEVAAKDVRDAVDKNTGRERQRQKPAEEKPQFSKFAKKLRASIEIALESDALAKSLAKVEEALPHITMRADRELVESIILGLGQIERRAEEWRTKRLVLTKKVTPLRIVEKKEKETND